MLEKLSLPAGSYSLRGLSPLSLQEHPTYPSQDSYFSISPEEFCGAWPFHSSDSYFETDICSFQNTRKKPYLCYWHWPCSRLWHTDSQRQRKSRLDFDSEKGRVLRRPSEDALCGFLHKLCVFGIECKGMDVHPIHNRLGANGIDFGLNFPASSGKRTRNGRSQF